MTLKCSAESKRRYVAQIAAFAAESSQFGAKTRYTQSGQELSAGVKEKFSLDEDTNINIDDIKILRSINQKSVNAFNSEDIKNLKNGQENSIKK